MSNYNNYIEKAENLSLPVVVLNGTVAFPSVNLNFEISEKASIAAAQAALETNSFILLVTNKKSPLPYESTDDLYTVGCVAKIKQSLKTPDKHLRIIAEGYSRATVGKYTQFADYVMADAICKTIHLKEDGGFRGEALIREGLAALEGIMKFLPSQSSDLLITAKSIKNPGLFADFVASNFLVKFGDKQTVLECFEPLERLECLIFLLEKEGELLNCEFDIHRQVREALNRHQQEFYLREQIKVIKEKLGDDSESECDEYDELIREAKLPDELKEKLLKENARISKMPFGTSEAALLRNYIDVCLELPWGEAGDKGAWKLWLEKDDGEPGPPDYKELYKKLELRVYGPPNFVPPGPDADLIKRIEKALGFRLFLWQKTLILHGSFRQLGSTTATCVRKLIRIKDSGVIKLARPRNALEHFEQRELMHIKTLLDKESIKTNRIQLDPNSWAHQGIRRVYGRSEDTHDTEPQTPEIIQTDKQDYPEQGGSEKETDKQDAERDAGSGPADRRKL